MTLASVLFVDDEEMLRLAAEQTFELAGVDVTAVAGGREALKHIQRDFAGVVVTDIRMPDLDGVALLEEVLAIDPDIPVVLVTGHGDVDLAVKCIKRGAYDFIEKPWQPERLVACVQRAIERRNLTLENRTLRGQIQTSTALRTRLYGRSAPMEDLRGAVRAVAATDVDLLLTGETGVGKELVARLIHAESERSSGPFVHINCAALPEALIENELFGHEAGAFPGALRARFGKLEHARGGVLCLDEIDSMSLPLQAKLLDVLHSRTVTRLGSNDAVALDIRVIGISKTDLNEAVASGSFRADLLYRLNVATIVVPPLTERREDIPGLFLRLVAEVAEQAEVDVPDVPTEALNALAARDWPGNVRELRNTAERYVLRLPDSFGSSVYVEGTLFEKVAAYEKALIAATISANRGSLKATYEALGLSRKTLYDKMQRYGLSRNDHADEADG